MNDPQQSAQPQQPSEEELRARLEEQLRNVRVQDLLIESAASLVNLSARRIAKEDERDLEQAKVGIEAVRALVGLIEGEVAEQIRNALSELQLLYARHAQGGAATEGETPPGQQQPEGPQAPQPGPGPGEPKPSSRLWTPGRDA